MDHINPGATPIPTQENFTYAATVPLAQIQGDTLNIGGKPITSATLTGGNAGTLISNSPKLGLSSYQISPHDNNDSTDNKGDDR